MGILFGLVLTGGKSRRMGQDKAQLIYRDKAQYIVCCDLLKNFCSQVFLSVRKENGFPIPQGITPLEDSNYLEGKGPLSGILSAWEHHPDQGWLVLGCDLPLVNEEVLNLLVQNRDNKKVATAFKSHYTGHPEPLCAIYEPGFKAIVHAFIKTQTFCPRKIMLGSDVKLIDLPNPQALDNINTPEEYARAVKQLRIRNP